MSNTSKVLDTVPEQTAQTDRKEEFFSTIIPKAFWLGGLKIDVSLDDTFVKEHKCLGQALYHRQEIIIDPSATPLQTTEQAFLHELIHWIFYVMGEDELRNNERIVDGFAHLLYQALSTKEPFPCSFDDDIPY